MASAVSSLHVGILAGESSGDILGAGLMQALKQLFPRVRFSGIGGPLMGQAGLQSMVPMERLSVMGLVEPLKRLPELLRIRRQVVESMLAAKPDVFIGIDSPDFNLGVELALRQQGIKTVHYVSPSVWAWRRSRIHKIARATDLVLALFPFEAEFYRSQQVPVAFVGHPLADEISLWSSQPDARRGLGVPLQGRMLALLPGSRQGEVARIGPVFMELAARLLADDASLRVLVPCASPARREQLEAMAGARDDRVVLLDGRSREAITAADAVVLASGTAALEAMLIKRPMLVCYRMAPLSYFIISRMLKVPWFSLPNLLAQEALVEELVQNEVSAASLQPKVSALLADTAEQDRLQERYREIHLRLRGGASMKAAEAIINIL